MNNQPVPQIRSDAVWIALAAFALYLCLGQKILHRDGVMWMVSHGKKPKLIMAFGKTKTLAEWAEESGIDKRIVWQRINRDGWPPEKALGKWRSFDD